MWDDRYSNKEYVYGKNANDFLVESVKFLADNSKVLCLAEGEGRNAVYLAKLGHEVVAIDSSSVGKEKAMALAKESDVELSYHLSAMQDYDFGCSRWDAIVSIFAHTDKETREKTFCNIKRSLKKGGIFILEGYNIAQLENGTGGPKSPEMIFNLENILCEFKDFEILSAQNMTRDIQEGLFHNGKSDVVQFVARKK
jgi:SAM-dependent methyltransferase